MIFEQVAHLLHLVNFRLSADRLQINDFGDSVAREDVVTSANSLTEAHATKHGAHVIESHIRI